MATTLPRQPGHHHNTIPPQHTKNKSDTKQTINPDHIIQSSFLTQECRGPVAPSNLDRTLTV